MGKRREAALRESVETALKRKKEPNNGLSPLWFLSKNRPNALSKGYETLKKIDARIL